MKTFLEIHQEAIQAAKEAEALFKQQFGEPFYCGFAWVKIYAKGNTKFGKEVAKTPGVSKAWDRGYDVWNPGGSGTQSMDVKESGARAYANVLNTYGIKCYPQSRAD